jgi:DNA-binding NarL/FixJ family response regulator
MKAVIVTFCSSPELDALSEQIGNLGIALTSVAKEADFAPLVDSLGRPPIVVYCAQGSKDALLVLEWARRHPVRLQVVVLVEKSNFSQYHECMHDGASAYDEISAGPERIARIIRRAGEGTNF